MNITTELVVRFTVGFVVGFTLTYTTCWALSTFLWGWLAVVLGLLLSWLALDTDTAQSVTKRGGDLAVKGAAHAINAFRSLRARLTD